MAAGTIETPDSVGSAFDHRAFELESRRVFIVHMARDRLEVLEDDISGHVATLRGFPEAAGVVAGKGSVLVTKRGSASLAWLDAHRLETREVLDTGSRPNGVAIVSSLQVAIVACIGDDAHKPQLQVHGLEGDREHSMLLVAGLPELNVVQHWPLPSGSAHGMDINHEATLLYVASDGGLLVEVDVKSGEMRRQWPLAGVPDGTFFNPKSGLVHVVIDDQGLIQSVDPRIGTSRQFITAAGAKTTALIEPDRLYVFSPLHQGILDLRGA